MPHKPDNLSVRFLDVDEHCHAQRIDNYLFTQLKGLPKSRIYRALRHGEIRVNGKRAKPDYRLQAKGKLRLPPLRVAAATASKVYLPPAGLLKDMEGCIIFEDENIIIINKPAGIAVHGGSGVNFGVIELMRHLRPKCKALELAHRLDRDTSGCLLIAKKRSILKILHELFAKSQVQKHYLALVKGKWHGGEREVNVPLVKNQLQSGERIVRVNSAGKTAKTRFYPLAVSDLCSLMLVVPYTGRTHQIRVHAAHIGHPVVGDEKYADKEFIKQIHSLGHKRLFLHAAELKFEIEATEQKIDICATLDKDFKAALKEFGLR